MATKRLFRNGDERLSRPPASTPQSRLSVPGWAWSLTKGLAQPLGQRGRLALAAALAIVALVAGLTGLRDPDTFHLLAVGRDIVRHRGFPTEDPFLYPLAGMPAGASASWLSAVAIYLSHVALGESGPVLLAGFLLGALLLVLALDAVDAKATAIEALAALVPLLLALWVLRWRSVARPEMFANVLLAITLFVLRRHYEGKATPLLWLLPLLAAVWSNLHQSAVAGIGVVLVYGAVGAAQLLMAKLAEWRREWAPETKTVRLAVATAGLMIGASLLNPSMTTSITTALAFVGNQIGLHLPAAEPLTRVLPFMKVGVEELRPLSAMDWVGPFGILVVLTAASFAVGFRAASPPDIAISAAFVVMALSAQRFAGVGALVLAPIAARNFAVGLSRVPTRSRAVARVVAGVTALGACVAAIVLLAGMDVGFGLGFRPDNFPVRAAQYLESIGFTGRLYNTFDFGGYLEWKLDRKFFQDGRLGLLAGDEQAAFTDTGHYGAFAALDESATGLMRSSSRTHSSLPTWWQSWRSHPLIGIGSQQTMSGRSSLSIKGDCCICVATARTVDLPRKTSTAMRVPRTRSPRFDFATTRSLAASFRTWSARSQSPQGVEAADGGSGLRCCSPELASAQSASSPQICSPQSMSALATFSSTSVTSPARSRPIGTPSRSIPSSRRRSSESPKCSMANTILVPPKRTARIFSPDTEIARLG